MLQRLTQLHSSSTELITITFNSTDDEFLATYTVNKDALLSTNLYFGALYSSTEAFVKKVTYNEEEIDPIGFVCLLKFILDPDFDGQKPFITLHELVRTWAFADLFLMFKAMNKVMNHLREAIKSYGIGISLLELVKVISLPSDSPLADFVLDLTVRRRLYGIPCARAPLDTAITTFVVENEGSQYVDGFMTRVRAQIDALRLAGSQTSAVFWPYGNTKKNYHWRYILEVVGECRKFSDTKKAAGAESTAPQIAK